MSDWPAALFAAAERLARRDPEQGPAVAARLAPSAARLGLRDDARRLAGELERAGGEWLTDAAQVYGLLGDRAAVDRAYARAPHDRAADPLGVQPTAFAAAYQRLGDDADADRIVETLEDTNARSAALAVLIHDAVAVRRFDRAASLARVLAEAAVQHDNALYIALALTTAHRDRLTAARTAPAAERAAQTLGEEIRDETMVSVARLWLAAGKPADALRVARPIAKRARRDFNSSWYADLARVLVDAGDEGEGQALFDRHVEWLEQQRSAAAFARAALALAQWQRSDDARFDLGKAEESLPSAAAGGAEEARRTLIDAYLSVGDVSAAIGAAAGLPRDTDKVKGLLAIAEYGHARAIPADASVEHAIDAVAAIA